MSSPTYLEIIAVLADSPEGIQTTWKRLVRPGDRYKAGNAVRTFLMSFSKVGVTREGKHYIMLKGLRIDKAIDIYRFFFEPSQSTNDFYFEE